MKALNIKYGLAGIVVNINPNHHNCDRLALRQVLLIAVDIKSICRPQRPFLSRSNESYIITYGLADLERQRNDLTCVVSRKINKNLLSTEKATREPTSTHSVIEIQSKRGSFSNFPSTLTGECILTGSGPWLIPMVLLDRMAKHDSRKAIEASLRANSPSQPTSFHLSLPIAIITGDYRQISYPVITTLVSLLGYNSAILYPSYFPLQLSGPSISNPPTSNSFNHLINPLGPLLPTGRGNQNKVLINRVVKLYKITHRRPQKSLLISIHAYLISVEYLAAIQRKFIAETTHIEKKARTTADGQGALHSPQLSSAY